MAADHDLLLLQFLSSIFKKLLRVIVQRDADALVRIRTIIIGPTILFTHDLCIFGDIFHYVTGIFVARIMTRLVSPIIAILSLARSICDGTLKDELVYRVMGISTLV